MEADTPEEFPRYGQYPSLCSADPPPLRNSEGKGGEGCTQATNNLTHAHCKGVLLDSPWCILVPTEPLDLAKGNDGLWGREWSRYCKLDD